MECKAFIPYFLTGLTSTFLVGSDGCIASSNTSPTAPRCASNVLWTNYQQRSMRYTNVRCEKSRTRTRNMPDDSFYASQSLAAHSELRNWRKSSHLISRDRFRHFAKGVG